MHKKFWLWKLKEIQQLVDPDTERWIALKSIVQIYGVKVED
jgi:hypothetical protein